MCFSPGIQQGHWQSVTASHFCLARDANCQHFYHALQAIQQFVQLWDSCFPVCSAGAPTLASREGVLQVVFSDSSNKHCFCCALWINCWAIWTSKPFSSLTCQSNILCSGKSSDNALQQTPTRNTLRLLSLAHLYHFSQRGLCIFKWELTANTGILFSTFFLVLTPRIQGVLAEPYPMCSVPMQDPTHTFFYQLPPSCSQRRVSQVFWHIPLKRKTKNQTKNKQNKTNKKRLSSC